MSVTQLHDVLAVLAIVALLGSVVMLIARLVPSGAGVLLLDRLHSVHLWLAAAVPTVASLGSLYFSEAGNNWTPCRFCWFQRIFMYSCAVILIVAAIRKDHGVKWYAVPLATIGGLLSGYHILLEHRIIEESTSCSSLTSCANPYYVSFGTLDFSTGTLVSTGVPMTLAVMALCGFLAIIALLVLPEPLDAVADGEPVAD
jgi:disulfide bond formation protein DsbB